jgi:hypothetical protein
MTGRQISQCDEEKVLVLRDDLSELQDQPLLDPLKQEAERSESMNDDRELEEVVKSKKEEVAEATGEILLILVLKSLLRQPQKRRLKSPLKALNPLLRELNPSLLQNRKNKASKRKRRKKRTRP